MKEPAVKGSRYTFKSEDHRDISAVKWIPEDEDSIVGAVQIFHGMAEHMERYDDFAQFLNRNGFVVIGNDLRGHGKSLASEGDTGIFSEKDGWEKVLKDTRKVTIQLRDQHRNLPIFLISHSMGTYFARDYISRWGEDLSGVILSATTNKSFLIINLLSALVSMEIFFRGVRHRSRLLDSLTFSSYNKPFEPGARTPYEWLTRDDVLVDRYMADPLCGFVCTASHYRDLAYGFKRICSARIYNEVPKELPLFLYSGDFDPMGGRDGNQVKEVYEGYRSAGVEDVILEFNSGGRHDSLNETNRQEVYERFLRWLKDHLPG